MIECRNEGGRVARRKPRRAVYLDERRRRLSARQRGVSLGSRQGQDWTSSFRDFNPDRVAYARDRQSRPNNAL